MRAKLLRVVVLLILGGAASPVGALTITAPVTPADEACTSSSAGFFDAPAGLLACGDPDCARLHHRLREHARTGDARSMLVRAAVAHYLAQPQHEALRQQIVGWPTDPQFFPNETFAQALADLAVTGQRSYASFRQLAPRQSDLITPVTDSLRSLFPSHPSVAADVSAAVQRVLDRAYQVAWALRGPTPHRAAQRGGLGWIAVDADDDPPHRPANVPSANFFQGNVSVRVGAQVVVTRYGVASRSITDNHPVDLQASPPDRSLPLVVGDVIIFVHGHSGSLEEMEPVVQALQGRAAAFGRPLTIIAMDLPTNGYASMIEHTDIAPAASSMFNTGYPILDFIENFIVGFVDALEQQQPGIKRQIVGVIGGSLGGNMTLRLARRDPAAHPWLHSAVSWSPASSWQSWARALGHVAFVPGRYYDYVKWQGVERTRGAMTEAEVESPYNKSSLNKLFYEKYWNQEVGRVAQAKHWYSPHWPCAEAAIRASHRALYEIYNPRFRRWHWRVAHEQLIYSHRDSDRPTTLFLDPNAGPPRYSQIRSRLLLATGADDDHFPESLHTSTKQLADLMTMVNGTTLYVANTGHSIPTERPAFFAGRVIDFLYVTPAPPFPYFLIPAANF